MILSNEGWTCRGHPVAFAFALTADSVRGVACLEKRHRWGVEDDLEVRLIAAAGLEKYGHRFRGSIL